MDHQEIAAAKDAEHDFPHLRHQSLTTDGQING